MSPLGLGVFFGRGVFLGLGIFLGRRLVAASPRRQNPDGENGGNGRGKRHHEVQLLLSG
ncbi:MAG: hypothetical protein H6942_15210 [Candidatus Accumulibacter sp.]|uniref:hypothetical protein n=1 Tax=Accumulibacter sp. TaxID=2053492 RepID=UPI001A080E59|nr:hypothetical protein [Accumulibacter sp.]MBE2257366.1 hypothetical protein [Paracoccaceae bacterium]MCB1940477.1 hypothetical protein [Accumulibacter sp.]MCP5249861.1 hypothetical protein [Accumulibacter sp.]